MAVYAQKLRTTQFPDGTFATITADTLTNSINILAPEPLASELVAYVREIDENVASTRSTGGLTPAAHVQAPRQLLFQGQTFERWVDLLETELDPKVRGEAFRALAMFGANGRGRQAAEIIFAHTKGYNYLIFDDSPEGRMKEAAIDALAPRVAHAWVRGAMDMPD